jgi:hypothetical protein
MTLNERNYMDKPVPPPPPLSIETATSPVSDSLLPKATTPIEHHSSQTNDETVI